MDCSRVMIVALCVVVLGGETVGKNADLTLAKKRKKDEFYTQLVDIENELKHYKKHFKDKVVLCNCDDPRKSNFFKYFADNFEKLHLKRLIATCYKSQDVDLFSQGDCERAICQIYEGDKNGNMVVDDDEKIDWFRTINIAGLELTEQEMRNAIYPGPWVSDAKRYFSKPGCVAYKLGGKYLKGEVDRQAYLETAIQWIAKTDKPKQVDEYMGIHQGDGEATELWLYFQKVINWVETIFPTYRKEMKGLDWGRLYAKYVERKYNPAKLDREITVLMADKEIQRHGGIYEFLFSDRTLFEKLNLRTFDPDDMRVAYENQKGVCPICKGKFTFEEMRGDHIKPWSKGGRTVPENLQMLCADCNARKSDKF